MSAVIQSSSESAPAPDMRQVLDLQRSAFLDEGQVSADSRIDRLNRAIRVLLANDQAIADALSDDFGTRPQDMTRLVDTAAAVHSLRYARKRVKRWMKPVKRSPNFPLNLLGARAEIRFQPKGVVGLISPWNFPINLTFMPLAGILAAGNRCMIKPSEYTPATSALLAEMIESAFDPSEVAVFQGGAQVGESFSSLAFDHLLFTGATSVGQHVMRAAAENLVPVTLELGGKSPVVIGESADLAKVADSIVIGKLMNAGQICLAPDYVLVPRDRLTELVDEIEAAVARMYPTLLSNPDYTAIINERHCQRLQSLLDEAATAGVEIVEVNPGREDFGAQVGSLKLPLSLLLEPADDLTVMRDEIFGPLLPLKGYDRILDAIGYINARPRPLGLYYFGRDADEEALVLGRTTSGGVTVNDVIQHVAQEALPFGGVGPSGMGTYHGEEGFREFSHARSVYRQSPLDIMGIAGIRPPYGKKLRQTIKREMKS